MKNNQLTCKNTRGNGASAFVCNKTGARCPYQKWCELKRRYEFKLTCKTCKDFEERK